MQYELTGNYRAGTMMAMSRALVNSVMLFARCLGVEPSIRAPTGSTIQMLAEATPVAVFLVIASLSGPPWLPVVRDAYS